VSYPDSVRYLYALGNELKAGAKFGLDRMRTLLDALGQPERDQLFVHVAGTNGKGSTSAMIASILREPGKPTGLFTSPHLIEPTERIKVDGQDVTSDEFAASFATVHAAAETLVQEGRIDAHPSYFETVTAMALLLFRQRTARSVIEVGLGGRLDATNVITPEVCVIMPVSYDHEAFLGNSLESIAAEKAGIIKAGVPLVLAPQHDPADRVITARAAELGAPIIRAADQVLEDVQALPWGSRFRLDGQPFECPLAGRHQIENATVAIAVGRLLGASDDALRQGVAETVWPGRLEHVSVQPDIVLDGAHNPAGAAALAAYLREFHAGRPVWLVYGAMRDKAIEEVIEQLFPLASRLILTAPDFPRALRPQAIRQIAGNTDAVLAETVADAIALAKNAPPEAVVIFTGSLYLVGEARRFLKSQTSTVS